MSCYVEFGGTGTGACSKEGGPVLETQIVREDVKYVRAH